MVSFKLLPFYSQVVTSNHIFSFSWQVVYGRSTNESIFIHHILVPWTMLTSPQISSFTTIYHMQLAQVD
jgi:hypothetical protein